jgi:serine/threonine-protein kinase RsbW
MTPELPFDWYHAMNPQPFSFLMTEDLFLMHDRHFPDPDQADPDGDSSRPLTPSGRVWAGTATVRTLDDIASVLQVLLDALQCNDFPALQIHSIRLAVHEAILNAVKHGHQNDPGKQVRIRYLINHVGLLAQIEDEGPGFRPDWVLNPPCPELRTPGCGRGLRLLVEHMSEVRYNASGNCVTLLKHRNS